MTTKGLELMSRRASRPKTAPASIPSDRLKTYLDAVKTESVLLGPVAQHLALGSMVVSRRADIVHPSEMAAKDWCPRASWHRLAGHPVLRPEPLTGFRLSLIFATGNDIHHKWQRWFHELGWLWGQFYCRACGEVIVEFASELPGSSPSCYNHAWDYAEVPLADPTLPIAGHADGVVDIPARAALDLVEIKSVGPGTLRTLGLLAEQEGDELSESKFSRITSVAGTHFRQVQIYLELSQRDSSVPALDEAVVIYENKADQQVREFVIARDYSYVEHLFGWVADIAFALDRGIEVKCGRGGCTGCASYEEA